MAKVVSATIYFPEDRTRMGLENIDNLLSLSMSLSSEAMANQHAIRLKVYLMKREMSRLFQDMASMQNQLFASNAQVIKLEEQMESYEGKAA